MNSLRELVPHVEFVGVGGEQMQSAGLVALENNNQLSIHGFLKPMLKMSELLRLIEQLTHHLAEVDVMVGVDFNVFNLSLEKRLKALSVPTVHYVSPSVYAWRKGRADRLEKSADVLLSLYPFEAQYYAHTKVQVEFVGHPMADEINPDQDFLATQQQARKELNLSQDSLVVALLPGSRYSEVKFHTRLFLNAAARFQSLVDSKVGVQFVVPCNQENSRELVENEAKLLPHVDVQTTSVNSRTVLAASNTALVKSGTGALEAFLLRKPMVVAYRIGWLTFAMVRSVLHTSRVALPNLLAGKELVPEFLQSQANPETLARALWNVLRESREDPNYFSEHERIHRALHKDASKCAAKAVLNLVELRSTL